MKSTTVYQYEINKQTIITTDITEIPSDIVPIILTHLCADKDKILTNGESTLRCVNTLNPSEWYEIDAPVYDDID